ncbi:MAG: molybdopterin-dependent oxidoreductase, partial [Actinobacteria bacterium]|nr:molybdopterin-dependent oxidoreductase [Actinomycetota bacterium]
MTALNAPVGRRQVLKGFLIAGPTLAIAARVGFADGAGAFPTKTDEVPDQQDFTDIFIAAETPTLYDLKIEIKPDNRVYAEGPRQDIGQGFLTTFAMQVADNLDVPMENMDVICSPAEQKRGAAQITGGSHNTRALWDPIRVVCAQMRGQLMTAGSQKLGVPTSALRTEKGYVVARDGRKVSYGELTALAATLPAAKAAMPKSSKDYKIVGKPHSREDAPKIVTGTRKYSSDLFSSKEYLPTVLAMAPTAGASVVSIDDSEAKKVPGFIAATQFPGMPDYL